MKQTAMQQLLAQLKDERANLPMDIEWDRCYQAIETVIQDIYLPIENEQMNHIVDTNEMVSDEVLFEQAIVAMEEIYGSGCDTEIDAYFRGAKWAMSIIRDKNTH